MRKFKKILSLMLSLAMLCSMFTFMSVTASAADNVIEVSNFSGLSNAINNAPQGTSMTELGALTKIKLTTDIEDGSSSIEIGGYKNIQIDFNGYTLRLKYIATTGYSTDTSQNEPSSLTLLNGTFINVVTTTRCLIADSYSSLTLKNMTIQSADDHVMNLGEAVYISDSTAVIENCLLISSSSATNGRQAVLKVFGESGTCTIKNSTLQAGAYNSSAEVNDNIILNESGTGTGTGKGTVLDGDGTDLMTLSLDVDTLTIGTGYIGNVLTPDGLPSGKTPVTATTTIPAPTYTVTIPATVDFGDQTQALEKYRSETNDQFGKAVMVSNEFTVSATGVSNLFNDLDDGKDDCINVTAAFNGTLKGTTNTENTVPYIIKQGVSTLTTGDKVATFYNDVDLTSKSATNSANATIYMNRADIKNADSYTGTITFTIAVADREIG